MKIILASQSPRRIELLEQFHIDFEVCPSEIEEVIDPNESPEQTVMALALEKAMDVATNLEDSLIIASDTIVFKDTILGKPRSKQDAFQMLKQLSGQSHSVYTGLAMVHLKTNTKIIDYQVTQVIFNELTDATISRYIASGEPMDKAGAYGIQGLGSVLVNRIHGDYFNVMGLPLSKLSLLLKTHFGIDLL